MSGSTRSRQKRKLEPISIEELAGTTGMSGFCTFLTRDSSVPVPALDRLEAIESGAPELPASELAACDTAASQSDAVVSTGIDPCASESQPIASQPSPLTQIIQTSALDLPAANSAAPQFTAVDKDAPDPEAPELGAFDSFTRRRIRIREASTVQDAHSLAEQAVYDAMYRAGRPYQGDSRILTIGLRTLAELSRMAYSNCKANVRSLVTKLAIDERPGFSYTEGRTYVVFSFREILRRRKAAGLTHVVRTRGVAFVHPTTGEEIPLPYAANSSAPDLGGALSSAPGVSATVSISSAPSAAQEGAPQNRESSAPVPGAHIENRQFLRKNSQESSSVPAAIVTVLRRYIADVDDEAAFQLWHRCLNMAPDATPEEIIHFIHLKAGKTGIRMPLGFLLTAVPKCFVGDSFRQFRQERAQTLRSASARDRQFAAEVLRNPEADDEQRQWASEILGPQTP